MKIESVLPSDYLELLAVWEDSVRATHSFISEEDIAFFKPIVINQAFPAVSLKCVKSAKGDILGFIGVKEDKIEMLFVLSDELGKGIGKALLTDAIDTKSVSKVDVNEQNPNAVAFYQYLGFRVINRSPVDDMGKPFPILHMSL